MSALRKVLVVDDDPVVGRSFHRVLSDKGYAVITASDGPEALRKLAEGEYDLVFTDIKMPGMDGIEVAERVRARRPWIPVVIVTGYGTETNEARAKAAGVADFLRKPLSPDMIEGSARKALLASVPAVAAASPAATVSGAPGDIQSPTVLKAVERAVISPFAGLLYIVAGPFIGLAVLGWMGISAAAKGAARALHPLRTAGLIVAAPLIGLAYAVAFPFIGLGALAWMGLRAAGSHREAMVRAAAKAARFLRNVALFFAAPFIGLAYAIAFPFIGIAVLVHALIKGDEPKSDNS